LCGGQATRQTRESARAGRARLHAGSAVRDHTLHTCLRGVGAVTLARAGGRRGTAGLSTIPQRADAVPMRGAEGAAASDEGVTTMRSRAPGGEVAHPEGRDCSLLAGTVGRATYRFAGARLRHADGHGNGDRGGREGDSETPLHSVLRGTSRFPPVASGATDSSSRSKAHAAAFVALLRANARMRPVTFGAVCHERDGAPLPYLQEKGVIASRRRVRAPRPAGRERMEHVVTIRLPAAAFARARALADADDRPRSPFLRRLLMRALEDAERGRRS